MRYAAFLQGINLGGQRKVPMAALRDVLTEAGFADVHTYVRSGNVVFGSSLDAAAAREVAASAISEAFGFGVSLVVVDGTELDGIIESNPYPDAAAADPTKVHVTLLDPAPDASTWDRVEAPPPEEFEARGRVLYVHLPNGMGRSKLAEMLRRATSDVTATTRNWRTMLAVAEMMRGG